MTSNQDTPPRREAGAGTSETRVLQGSTLASVLLHAAVLVVFSLGFIQPKHEPVFAEPIYTVAFLEAPMPNLEPPKKVSTPPKKEAKPAPAAKVEAPAPDDAVKVADKVTPTPETKTEPQKPKPVVKAPKKPEKKPLKPPAQRPDATETAAASEVESPVKDAPEEPVSLGMVDQKNFRHSYYLELIRARLAKEWNEPRTDAKVTKASVHFVIRRDGTVASVEIREASGSGVYDRAALGAVRGVDRFPPLPESYAGDEIGITVVFQTMWEGR